MTLTDRRLKPLCSLYFFPLFSLPYLAGPVGHEAAVACPSGHRGKSENENGETVNFKNGFNHKRNV